MKVNKAINNIMLRYWQRRLLIYEERTVLSTEGKGG